MCVYACLQIFNSVYACSVVLTHWSVYADSESESEDSSAPDTGTSDIEDSSVPAADERDEGSSEDFPEEEGRYHTIANHLAKIDGLAVRECADMFFNAHKARWGSCMPRPGDALHSGRHGGEDARESRKRKAGGINRSLAESHAFITASNLADARGDRVLETFCNVRRFEPIARWQSN